ncbi:cytochrome b [Bradyrhizobium aeschynomenes]|uniref:cytochrome b n=1 Tax=Bradyrhizobium aeschynomenes TaxID=2734909 RepID=UPI003D321124
MEFGATAKFFHWTSAAAFIAAYAVVYYVIWFMDDTAPEVLPVLNVHWVLGIFVGVSVVPRLLWRLVNVQPDQPHASHAEAWLAHAAHLGLYALLILMPLTGYIGTDAPTDFGAFAVPSFRETALFGWIETRWGGVVGGLRAAGGCDPPFRRQVDRLGRGRPAYRRCAVSSPRPPRRRADADAAGTRKRVSTVLSAPVIARSEATKPSRVALAALDGFAALAMTPLKR